MITAPRTDGLQSTTTVKKIDSARPHLYPLARICWEMRFIAGKCDLLRQNQKSYHITILCLQTQNAYPLPRGPALSPPALSPTRPAVCHAFRSRCGHCGHCRSPSGRYQASRRSSQRHSYHCRLSRQCIPLHTCWYPEHRQGRHKRGSELGKNVGGQELLGEAQHRPSGHHAADKNYLHLERLNAAYDVQHLTPTPTSWMPGRY